MESTGTFDLRGPALKESQALHARVLDFARRATTKLAEAGESFEALALDIARFQRREIQGFARLCSAELHDVGAIPSVWVDTFRFTRVATHPPELDVARFQTSGTTARESGVHPVRDLRTYESLCLTLARASLFRGINGPTVVVALAEPSSPGLPHSSLVHMMELFVRTFDGRSLAVDPEGTPFDPRSSEHFLISRAGVDLEGLRRAAKIARHRREPLVVLGAAFAFAAVLDALDDEELSTPPDTRLMITGGFKGRRQEIPEEHMRVRLAEAFSIDPTSILGEYGMTELTSQLYEAWSGERASSLHKTRVEEVLTPQWFPERGRPGLYFTPPWLRVEAVDPVTLERKNPGEPGLARCIDLANIDSAVSVLTLDLIREVEGGVELMGRSKGAPPRGCSLPFEGLLRGGPR